LERESLVHSNHGADSWTINEDRRGNEQTAAAAAGGGARGVARGGGVKVWEYGKMSSVSGTKVEEVAESDGIEIHLLLRGIARG
jgi:hypothetical protein